MATQHVDAALVLDTAHTEAYTVIILGILTGAALVARRPWCGKSFPDGCGDATLRTTGGGSAPASYLFVFRLATCVYATCLFIHHAAHIGVFRILRFYTLWNWIILATYFGLAAHESWKLMRLSTGQPPKVGRIGQACVVLFHICITNAMLIDTVTWTALVPMLTTYNPDREAVAHFNKVFYSFYSYNEHGANIAFMLVDLFLNNIQFFPHMLGFIQLLSSTFGIWANIYFLVYGEWLYPFLDTSKPYAWEAYLALFAAHWVFYAATYLLFQVKARLPGSSKAEESKESGKSD